MDTNFQKLSGKVAIVTGASKGIGAGIAKRLAHEGATVVINHSSSRAGADKVVDEITKARGKAVAVQADVANKADVERMFFEAKKANGRVDIPVNNAGNAGDAGTADLFTEVSRGIDKQLWMIEAHLQANE
jgi:3-oxoacyl-[acyl-carrier protein] reductase